MKSLRILTFLLASVHFARADEFLPGAKRILFLGDSITYAGHYVDDFELFLFTKFPDRRVEVIDCGLPSETVSGLSEAGHAGGKFPRPDLHERLDRVLATVKPDLVFACYGMNCGIYLPFDEGRFAKYEDGIRRLREKVQKSGAQIIHLTPPVFDPLAIKARVKPADLVKDGDMFEGYNGVLDRYSAWLVARGRSEGWRVIDTHSAMAAAIETARKAQPDFTFAKDGVHANEAGHHVLAVTILKALGGEFEPDSTAFLEARKLIRKRGRLLADAYLNAAGHRRPGMAKGLPIGEARSQAAGIEKQLRETAAK